MEAEECTDGRKIQYRIVSEWGTLSQHYKYPSTLLVGVDCHDENIPTPKHFLVLRRPCCPLPIPSWRERTTLQVSHQSCLGSYFYDTKRSSCPHGKGYPFLLFCDGPPSPTKFGTPCSWFDHSHSFITITPPTKYRISVSRETPTYNRGRVPLQLMDERGYEDCDYVSHEENFDFWKSFGTNETPMELHVPCRDPIDHLSSMYNHKRPAKVIVSTSPSKLQAAVCRSVQGSTTPSWSTPTCHWSATQPFLWNDTSTIWANIYRKGEG